MPCLRPIVAAIAAALLAPSAALAQSSSLAQPATPLEFARDVMPVLSKAGCNVGACHGSFQGRGGLQLSLWGFDPAADYEMLVKRSRGRRVFPASPEKSLLLAKPTLAVPHGGGKRLAADSTGYGILRDWIAQGLAPPMADDARLVRMSVTPPAALLQPGEQVSLRVEAAWSDGQIRDVTEWAAFESRETHLAEVTAEGRVTAVSPGKTSISVRYLGLLAAAPVTAPFAPTSEGQYPPADNFIDELVQREWRDLGIVPAPLADDAEFLRRAHLDLIGTLPTPDEERTFLAATDPDKRRQTIDRLLDRPEYVEFWALRYSDMLRVHRRSLGEKGLWSFQGWIRDRLRANAPLDEMVRELIVARGNLYQSGAVAYYFVDKTPEELAETTAQLFLGVRLQCAKCHHHPFEVWTQDDYYGMAAFFTGIERKDNREGGAFGGAQSLRVVVAAPLRHPADGREMRPTALGWRPETAADDDVRAALADWIAADDNPFFARNLVNRYWNYLFGRGLVEPADDMRATNPPTHPELLDRLTREFKAHDYDARWLLRTICNSRAWQLASEVAATRDLDGAFYTHRVPRRMPAEVLLDAVNQATETSEAFAALPPGRRAISLPDSDVASYFLETFGRPRRTSTCLCERGNRPDLRQALHLANSDAVHAKLTAPDGRVARLLAGGGSDAAIVEELYLATLSRMPTDEERALAAAFVVEAPARAEGIEDLLWTLLNCSEFAFSH